MKISISANKWRVRISENNMSELLAGNTIGFQNQIANELSLSFDLRLVPENQARIFNNDNQWFINLPIENVLQFQQTLPSKKGVVFNLGDLGFQIELQVDIRDRSKDHN